MPFYKQQTKATDFANWRRSLSNGVYATDVDLLLWRGDGEPLALIELKYRRNQQPARIRDTQRQALRELAARAQLPLFLVTFHYPHDNPSDVHGWRLHVKALNDCAESCQPTKPWLTRYEYREWERTLDGLTY